MKFKSAFKYQLSESIRPLIIFYIVIYAIFAFMMISSFILKGKGYIGGFGGMETASIIFIFIAGLNSFKSSFHMLLVNGVSRRTMFTSHVTGVLPVAAAMALIDTLNHWVFSSFSYYNSLFSYLYEHRYGNGGNLFGTTFQISLEGFLWMFFTYAMMAMIGFFITTLYYRMNKPIKLAVSIGVPVFLFVVLPYMDIVLFSGGMFKAIGTAIAKAFGFLNGSNPYIAMLSCTIIFALFGLLSYLLMRRATVKEA